MKLEVLMSCMHQTDDALIQSSHLTGNVLVVNQCDREHYTEFPTAGGIARMIFTRERGLTKSRNMAIAASSADLCLLCDDDEVFLPDYEKTILRAYTQLPQADVIIFKMTNRPPSFPDKILRLRFPRTAKVSSWQISFRRQRLLDTGVRFDPLLGAGSGNGAEEELKFLLDCQKAGLKIYYVPAPIASVAQEASTWFSGFDEGFFFRRGATTRYILGLPLSLLYALYYVLRKRPMYRESISPRRAFRSTVQGIWKNPISRQAKTHNG